MGPKLAEKPAVINLGEVSFIDAIEDIRSKIGKGVQESSLDIPNKKPGVYDSAYFGFIYKNKDDGKEWVRLYTPVYDEKGTFSNRVYITETAISNLNNANKKQLDALQGHILNTPGRSIGEYRMMREIATGEHAGDLGYDTHVIYRFTYNSRLAPGTRKQEYFPIGMKVIGQLEAETPMLTDVSIPKPARLQPLGYYVSDAINAVKEIIAGLPPDDVNKINVRDENEANLWLRENIRPPTTSEFTFSKLNAEERKQLREALKAAITDRILAALDTGGPRKTESGLVPVPIMPAQVVESQADQNARTFKVQEFINNSFLTAVTKKNYDEFLYRLYHGADVNTTGDYSETALMWAVHPAWDKKFADVLLSCGALINRQEQLGNTALHIAVKFSNVEMVKVLLEHGADPNIKNNAGETPQDIIKPVLYEGADVGESRAYPTTYATIPREFLEQQDIHDTMKRYLREVHPLDKFSSDAPLQEMKEAIVSAISKAPKNTLTQLIAFEVDKDGNTTSPDVPNPSLYSWLETNLNNELGGRNFNFSLLPEDIKRFLRGEFSPPALARLSAIAKRDEQISLTRSGSTGNSEIDRVSSGMGVGNAMPTAQKEAKNQIPKPSGLPRIRLDELVARREKAKMESRHVPTEPELQNAIRTFVNLLDTTTIVRWSEGTDVVNEILRKTGVSEVPSGISRNRLVEFAGNEISAHLRDLAPSIKKTAVSYDLEDLKKIVTGVVNNLNARQLATFNEASFVNDSFSRYELTPQDREILINFAYVERLRRSDALGAQSLTRRAREEQSTESARRAKEEKPAESAIVVPSGPSPAGRSAQRDAERLNQMAEQRQLEAVKAERQRASVPPAVPVVVPVSPPIVSLTREAVSIQDVAKSFSGSYTPGQLLELNKVFSEAPEARKYTYAYHIVYQKQTDDGSMLLFVKAHGGARIYKYEVPAGVFDKSDSAFASLRAAGASNSEASAIATSISKSFVSNRVTGEVQSLIHADGGVGNMNYLSLGKQRDEYRIPAGTIFSRLLAPIDFVKDFLATDKLKYLAEPTENPNDYELIGTTIAGTRALIFKEHKSAMESAISSYKEGNPEQLAKLLLSYAMEGQATSAPHIQVLSIYLMYRLQQEKLMDFTGLYTKINGRAIKPLKDAEDILKRARTKAGAQEVFAILQEWENRKIMDLGKEGAVSKLTDILNYANENFMTEKPPKGYSRSGKIYPYLKNRAAKKIASEVNPVDGKLGPITLMAWMFVMTEAVKETPAPKKLIIETPRTISVNLYPKIDEDATITHQNEVSFHADVFVRESGKNDAKLDNYRTEHGNPQSLKFVNYAWMVSVLVEGKRYLFNSQYGVDGDEQRYSAVYSPGKNVAYALDFKGGKHVIRKEGTDNVVALEFDRDGNPIVKDSGSGTKSLFRTTEPNITVPRIGVSTGPQYEAAIFILDPNRQVPVE